jgi:hypothetical protein
LRDAVADAVPATSTEVPLVGCSTSTDPVPFAATEPLPVMALTPPAPVRLAVGAGFCAVAEADGATLEVTLGFEACAWEACAWAAALTAELVTVLVALDVADVALAPADFESAAADSVEPVTLAAAAFPLLETLPAV